MIVQDFVSLPSLTYRICSHSFLKMSSNTTKSREEILAERQEKKKKKAAAKNQPKEKSSNVKNETCENLQKKNYSVPPAIAPVKETGKHSDARQSVTESLTSNLGDKSLSTIANEKKQDKTQKSSTDKSSENEVKKIQTENTAETVKTKAELKALRRAKQEAERARKLEKTLAVTEEKKVTKTPVKPPEPVKVPVATRAVPDLSHKVKLFAHLYKGVDKDFVDGGCDKIHPSIIQLGVQYSSKVVSGANACCLALLSALKKVVMDYETPQNQEFSRGLEAEISKSMSYLNKCRPVAVSMVNAVKHLKFQVSQSKGNDLECKNNICEWIDVYIKEQLEMAAKAICLFVREKIAPGDVILTYGCSSLIQQILISVHNEGINFQVVVVDGRPWLEGREMLRKLVSAGIHCTYVFVNGLSFIMPEVTKVLLGAHALLANGYVMSRAGSSQVALLAKAYNVPVLVCCETHKFSERVQTDSFVHNELGNPDDLASKKGCMSQELSKWKSIQSLTPLNLTYDVTPPDLVSAVVTEIAVLPCTSVPVILRIKPPDVSY